jgi:small conductance mechanosensitive channel
MAALRSSFCSNRLRWLGLAFSLGLALALWAAPPAVGQDTPLPAQPTAAVETGNDMAEQFFADVLVRGKPVFQVGSLDRLSALDRARQINRRIAGLLNQDQPLDPVTVHLDNRQNLATPAAEQSGNYDGHQPGCPGL